ncbi:MAG: T9SS type A sorting domain-containing protein, partial [Ignavibacteriaceae bacterium]|nr:T9SS type A sorting domain-containing protein [Ignavibacteriaceae bacterium]MCC6254439.1 T9SS type A sorting domain-containing protein [Ignavibacteriaceae bacterium]
EKVATLVNGNAKAGSYEINFNASQLSSGVYFYSIEAGDFKAVRKMMLMK